MERFGRFVPLFLLFVFIGILGFIGFVVYSTVMDVKTQAKKKMDKKNVKVSRVGMTVGVKELKDEDYKDRSQSVLVSVWNHSSFPAYKSRLWGSGANTQSQGNSSSSSSEYKRKWFLGSVPLYLPLSVHVVISKIRMSALWVHESIGNMPV